MGTPNGTTSRRCPHDPNDTYICVGFKTTIILEELKAAYGFRYDFQAIDMWVRGLAVLLDEICRVTGCYAEKRAKGAMVLEGGYLLHPQKKNRTN